MNPECINCMSLSSALPRQSLPDSLDQCPGHEKTDALICSKRASAPCCLGSHGPWTNPTLSWIDLELLRFARRRSTSRDRFLPELAKIHCTTCIIASDLSPGSKESADAVYVLYLRSILVSVVYICVLSWILSASILCHRWPCRADPRLSPLAYPSTSWPWRSSEQAGCGILGFRNTRCMNPKYARWVGAGQGRHRAALI
jgi:hypothetical protein